MAVRHTMLGVAVIVAAVGALLFPSLIGLTVLSPADQIFSFKPFGEVRPPDVARAPNLALTDVNFDFTPYTLETRGQVRDGKLPLWNPYSGAGRPLLAWQQVAPFYPLTLPSYVFPYLQAQAWIIALKLIVAGLGLFTLCRALGLSSLAAAMASLGYALSTYLVFWMEHPHINSYALFPWLLFAVNRVVTRADIQSGLLVGALVGIAWLGGHPPSTAIVLLGTAAFFLFRLVQARTGAEIRGSQLRRISLFGVGIVAGTTIGAVMLVPFIEYLGQAYDPSRGGGAPSLRPNRLGVFLLGPQKVERVYSTEPRLFAAAAYLGVAPVLLAAASLFVRQSATKVFFVTLGVGALVLVVKTPLSPLATVVRELPILAEINLDRLVVVTVLSLAVLSGFGLDDLITATRTGRRRMVTVMLALALLSAGFLVFGSPGDRGPRAPLRQLPSIDEKRPLRGEPGGGVGRDGSGASPGVGSLAAPGRGAAREPATNRPHAVGRARPAHYAVLVRWLLLAGTVVGIAFLVLRRPGYALLGASAVVLVTALDLVTMDYGIHPQVKESRVKTNLPSTLQYLRATLGHQRFVGVSGTMPPNLATRFELRDARWGSPPHLERYHHLWTRFGGVVQGSSATLLPNPDPRLGDATSVRYILVPWELRRFYPGQVVAGAVGDHVLVDNRDALPRAWTAYSWASSAEFPQALAAVNASTAQDLFRRPVLEGAPPEGRAPKPGPIGAEIVEDGDDRVVVNAAARQDGYVVLNDMYYPGWRAEVDGRPAPILAANASFRAVRVPRGRHQVAFTYRPASVRVGLLITMASLAGLGVAAAAIGVRAKRRRRTLSTASQFG